MKESENRIISLPKISDVRGNLSIIEQYKHVPFEIRRVYWIYDVPGGLDRVTAICRTISRMCSGVRTKL